MKRKNFYLDTETDNRLDALASYRCDSRAGVLRDLVFHAWLAAGDKLPDKPSPEATTAPYASERKEALG